MTRTTRQSAGQMNPPPPPTATTTTAPTKGSSDDNDGPTHKRIRSPLLDKVFERALKASLSGVTPEAWHKCFPTPSARRPEQMLEVRRKFCEIYELNVRKNFEDILATRKLFAGLDNLDILIAEAQARRARFLEENPSKDPANPPPSSTSTQEPAPEPQGQKEPLALHEFSPQDLYTSHLYPLLQLQSDRLTDLKTRQQASIDTLIARRIDQQAEIRAMIATLDKRLSLVDDAADGVKEILEMDDDAEDP